MKQIYKNITDIDNGGLIEQANLDFSKIMASINDLNTDKRKAAKLVIEIQIKAHEDDDFADVQSIVRLQPINTYPELSPVETMYLLRVDKDGEVALFEADGNRWEFEAQCRIREYLFMNLKEEIENESVIIVG